MRKLLILLFLVMCTCLKAQVSTNKIQNTATIYATNSPVLFKGLLGGWTNFNLGGTIVAGTNSLSGAAVGAHFLVVSNAGNPVLVLKNMDPTGGIGFIGQNASSTDSGFIGFERNGSNILIHPYLNAGSYTRITTPGGTPNELYIHPSVTTNTIKFVSGGISSTNYQANGTTAATAWVTNVGIGETNVVVYTNGLFMGRFTIP